MNQAKFSNKTILEVWNKTKGKCWYCGDEFSDSDNGYFTVDHVIPLSETKNNSPENLVPCCKSCNSSKRNRSINEFRLMYQKRMGMVFDFSQIMWLAEKGIAVPDPDKYLFYFEKEGLE